MPPSSRTTLLADCPNRVFLSTLDTPVASCQQGCCKAAAARDSPCNHVGHMSQLPPLVGQPEGFCWVTMLTLCQ